MGDNKKHDPIFEPNATNNFIGDFLIWMFAVIVLGLLLASL